MTTAFRTLTVRNHRQFGEVVIDFHPRLTVITGVNGAGKTALLRILAAQFGWEVPEPAVPTFDPDTGSFSYRLPLRDAEPASDQPREIGSLSFVDGQVAKIVVGHRSETYRVAIAPRHRAVWGVFVPSHRPAFRYQAMGQVPTAPPAPGSEEPVSRNWRQRDDEQVSNYYMKRDLITWAMHSYDTPVVAQDLELKRKFEAFQDMARTLLPKDLGFESFKVRRGEVLLVTRTGEFSFDAVSGGVAALLELGWVLLFARWPDRGPMVAVIDEAENHLHPAMQRELLPNLLAAFPDVQFVVSTHSPFVVGAVEDSAVYALHHGPDNLVRASLLDLADRAGTAADILRDVLGVPVTVPVWVEHRLEDLAERFADAAPTTDTFRAIRAELARDGLEEFAPEAIAGVVSKDLSRA